jgi:nitroreductase
MSTREVTPEVQAIRNVSQNIEPLILNRWSPRAFAERAVSDEVLTSLFEAARYAPSASNLQPWRFIVAKREEDRRKFHSFIVEKNRQWCERAPVLVLVAGQQINAANGKPNRTYAFDTGAAWAYLALEATRQGLIVHAMAGFMQDKAREALGIPEHYEPLIVIAIGYRGDVAVLDPEFQEREKPSARHPLTDTVFEGRFPFQE